MSPGAKFFEWESKGVPLRIEIGPRDVDQGTLCVVRRFLKNEDSLQEAELRKAKKSFVPKAQVFNEIKTLLMDQMQKDLLERARARRDQRLFKIDSMKDFEAFVASDTCGFAFVHWAGGKNDEAALGKRFETSIRCIPYERDLPETMRGPGTCLFTGQASSTRVIMAKAY